MHDGIDVLCGLALVLAISAQAYTGAWMTRQVRVASHAGMKWRKTSSSPMLGIEGNSFLSCHFGCA